MPRPKGSKNRPKEVIEAERAAKAEQPKRGRGRPVGSKNKPKGGKFSAGPGRKFELSDRQAMVAAKLITHREELAVAAKENKHSAAMQKRILGLADPGDNAAIVNHIMSTAFMPPIDINDAEAVRQRVIDHAKMCVENDMKMTIESTALALGINRDTFRNIATGAKKKPSDVQQVFAWAYTILQNVASQAMIEGKLPTVGGIFLMRNNFGYINEDRPDVESGSSSGGKSTEEIAEKYKDLPE